MDTPPEPLTEIEKRQLAEDFAEAAWKGDLDKCLRAARRAGSEAPPEDIMRVFQTLQHEINIKSTEILDEGMHREGQRERLRETAIVLPTAGIVGMILGLLLERWDAFLHEPDREMPLKTIAGITAGTLAVYAVGPIVRNIRQKIRELKLKKLETQQKLLNDASSWWYEHMPPDAKERYNTSLKEGP